MRLRKRKVTLKRVETKNLKTQAPKEKVQCTIFYRNFKKKQLLNLVRRDVFIFHIANEQNTSAAYTRSLMAMGLTPGIPDYCILIEGSGRVAFIEWKRDKSSKQTPAQKAFEQMCNLYNIPYLLTYNEDEAFKFIEGL